MTARCALLRTVSMTTVIAVFAGCTLIDTARQEAEIVRKADAYKDVRPLPADRALVSFESPHYFGSRVVRTAHGEPLPEAIATLRVTIRRSAPA